MTLTRSVALLVIVLALGEVPSAQAPQTLRFAVSASDASGTPVTDLKPDEVIMTENGVRQQVVKVEPLSVPIKLTIAVDNGIDSADALVHYRAGLKGLVEALPPDVEITLISIAPQPLTVLRPTTDRTQVLRAINGFAPEQAAPRFSDALVEFSERLQREARDRTIAPYVPLMIMLSTTSVEQTSYKPPAIAKAMNFLVTRRARLNMIVISTRTGQATSAETLNASLQAIIGIPVVKATNGRYEALAASSRLTTLLCEWGKDVAALHRRQTNQVHVTVERKQAGDLQNPRIELVRTGLNGQVTIDGFLP